MTATVVVLNREWRLGGMIAQGGFGEVYSADADDGSEVVVKLVRKEPGAARELLFEPISGLPNVIPIIDCGEWQDNYVIVMPRAEKSLRQYLYEAGGELGVDEAIRILVDIASALDGLHRDVVHRDLKPENILLHEGYWCLADFGIARYAEATTSDNTLKYALSPAYAAPEQWRFERATSATDIYALGIIAYEMLANGRPFLGPDKSDYREQHLGWKPAQLQSVPPQIASLVAECLYKEASARPTPSAVLRRLRSSLQRSSQAVSRLQQSNLLIVDRQVQHEAMVAVAMSAEERRTRLVADARQAFNALLGGLAAVVCDAAPSAVTTRTSGLVIRLGDATLIVDSVQTVPAISVANLGFEPAFDVAAYSAIAVRRPRDHFDYEGRGHSLWFCDAYDEGKYRWYETAFMITPVIRERSTLDPFPLPPTDRDAIAAFAPGITIRQVAWQPVPFDQGDEDPFIERWVGWFASAVDGTLCRPSRMPEPSGGRYRRP